MMAALDELDAAWDKLACLPVHSLGPGATLDVLDRLETHRRRQPAMENDLLIHLQASVEAKDGREIVACGAFPTTRNQRCRLQPPFERGPPNWGRGAPSLVAPRPATPGTAAAQRAVRSAPKHVTVIPDFFDHLPAGVDVATRRLPKPSVRTRGHSDPRRVA